MNIKDRIRERRLELGMTQDELADKVGFKTKGSVCKLETGDRSIPIGRLRRLAEALETSVDYLIGNETSKTGDVHEYYHLKMESNKPIDKDSALHRIMDLLLTHKKEFTKSDLEWIKQNIDFFLNEIEIPRN